MYIKQPKLNLYDLAKSDIKYKLSYFPDSQQQLTIEGDLSFLMVEDSVEIISRLNSFMDLERIILATKACKNGITASPMTLL